MKWVLWLVPDVVLVIMPLVAVTAILYFVHWRGNRRYRTVNYWLIVPAFHTSLTYLYFLLKDPPLVIRQELSRYAVVDIYFFIALIMLILGALNVRRD